MCIESNTKCIIKETGGRPGPTGRPGPASTFFEKQVDRFCEYRDLGQFVYPPNCRVRIECLLDTAGNTRAIIRACPEGQNFHPIQRKCVPESVYSCVSPIDSGKITTHL